jgi:hypothetical protein
MATKTDFFLAETPISSITIGFAIKTTRRIGPT